MSINEINPANSLKTGVDSFTGLPGSISDINRELFGQPLSKAPNSAFGSIPMNSLLEADDRSISAIQTKARSGASSVYGNESGIFPIDRAAVQVGKALMDNTITARVPSGDLVDRTGQYDELLNPNPSNLSATVRSGDTQKELGTGSDWRELQKADSNGFTEREAYKLLPEERKDYELYKPNDGKNLTLEELAEQMFTTKKNWTLFKKKNGDSFSKEEAKKPIPADTEVYYPGPMIKGREMGTALEDRWIEHLEKCYEPDDKENKDKNNKVFTGRRWVYPKGTKGKGKKEGVGVKIPLPGFLSEGPVYAKRIPDIAVVLRSERNGEIVIHQVVQLEIKISKEEAEGQTSKQQQARDQVALNNGYEIRDPKKTKNLYKPTAVIRIYGKEPPEECPEDVENIIDLIKELEPFTDDITLPEKDSEEHPEVDVEREKPKPRPPVGNEPPKINLPPRPPVGNEPPREPPKTNPPAGNEPPREPPKTNPPAGNEPPKTNPPARPPAVGNVKPSEPPKINPPVRPPVRPPALSGALNIGSKIARPLGLVTDVIDLKNAYDEDGGFGKNFQETAGGVAGGWGGAAAGAAAGAALGSVVPGFGTVAGGIVGGVIGGIGGSAAGEGIVKGVRDFFG